MDKHLFRLDKIRTTNKPRKQAACGLSAKNHPIEFTLHAKGCEGIYVAYIMS